MEKGLGLIGRAFQPLQAWSRAADRESCGGISGVGFDASDRRRIGRLPAARFGLAVLDVA